MKKAVFIIAVSFIGLLIFGLYQYYTFSDKKLHVIFCNVGQGDGILVTTPYGKHIIFDGGPDDSILDCLSRHLAFYDKTIDLMILSHPHADHYTGLISILERYKVLHYASEKLTNNTIGFKTLEESLDRKHVPKHTEYKGDKIRFSQGLDLAFVGPSDEFLKQTSPNGQVGESSEFASLIVYLSYGSFDLLLTGDTQGEELASSLSSVRTNSLEILQVPHHGSKTGLTQDLVQTLKPKLAVISVGKNKYGHPSPFTLETLSLNKVKTMRTDKDGEVEIISDGKNWFRK